MFDIAPQQRRYFPTLAAPETARRTAEVLCAVTSFGLHLANAMALSLVAPLAPLLWVQGVHTRRKTVVLPEPPGPRSGRTGSGSMLRLLIAGDSAAAGVGVDHQDQALSGQLQALLAPRFDLHWELIARTGHTTADLLGRLQAEPARPFDVVVLSLGVNDVTGLVPLHRWVRQQRALVTLLKERFGAQQVLLGAMPPMGEMLAMPQPLRAVMGQRAALFNKALTQAMLDQHHCQILRLPKSGQPGALACDGFHPGEVTYRAWALEVARKIMI
jgi:lysophospholipase L1-like esterase